MKVHWTATAEEHLDSIFAYIRCDSPKYAKRTVDRITARSKQIARFPFSGSIVPEFESTRIRQVIEGFYRIIYYVKHDQIDVLAVLHQARNLLSEISEE